MKRFKVAGLTAASHLSKMLVTLFIIKQIAITHGAEGLGLLGNYMSLATIASSLAGGGIISGVIKYVSEYSSSKSRQYSFIGSALIYTICSAIFIFILGVIFIDPLTQYLFSNIAFKPYIYFFLYMQFIIALNNCAFGVLNGLKKNSTYASIILTGNCISIAVAYYCIQHADMWGMIIAIMMPLVCPILPIFVYIFIQKSYKKIRFFSLIHDCSNLSKFSLMLIISAICFPVVEMLIRNQLIDRVGLDAAGYWQAITKLSSAYLSFYSLFLTFYFIPIMSTIKEKKEVYTEVKKMLVFIGILFICMTLVFISLKNPIISLTLSRKFISISNLFLLQILGDFFRVMGWVIGFVIIAKAATKLYILSELFQGTIFLLFSYLNLAYHANLSSVIHAYITTCFLYFLIMIIAFFLLFREKKCHAIQSVSL